MPAATPIEPGLEYVVTVTLIVADIARSTAFYHDVLGAEVLEVDEPTLLRLGNIWLIINVGGGPTDDKPEVIATAPRHSDELSLFLNLRVTDIKRFYQRCRARGAVFINRAQGAPVGTSLLYARSRRLSDRSRADDRHKDTARNVYVASGIP